MPVRVPVVTSTVNVPAKVVPVKGAKGVQVPETLNAVIVSAAAKPGANSIGAISAASRRQMVEQGKVEDSYS